MANFVKATMATPRSSDKARERNGVKPGAILLMGLPGAGKGTQAFRLAAQFPNFVHFDTGGEIYRRVTDPHFANDPLIQEQRRIHLSGDLNTPEWVAGLVSERIRFYSGKGQGVIFSGSPRTLLEAEAIVPLLQECYGPEQILGAYLGISEGTAKARARNRLTCPNKGCRYPTTRAKEGTPCPKCETILEEDPEERWKINELPSRFREFRERTAPTIDFLGRHFGITKINAEKSEEEIFAALATAVRKKFKL